MKIQAFEIEKALYFVSAKSIMIDVELFTTPSGKKTLLK
jgi:hypothetical protein